ncbi:adenylate/guanylate cyclase domain-containing protein [Robiginitalea sp. IMCC44478]|uniref:adenylate/guanylate cyclase domain-containing protein n=1 Tax=Robiginitalea sp. IMCC44478 TaxID=3459122 RepID=UPI00404294AF
MARILPFGLIWLLLGWYNLFTEAAVTGNQNLNPETTITLSPSVFIFASLAVTFVGLTVGALEILWLGNLFKNRSLGMKLLFKTGFYALFLFGIILLFFPLASSIELGIPFWSEDNRARLVNFLFSLTFISTMVSIVFSLLVSLFYAEVSNHIGHTHLLKLLSGRYHNPVAETRIFLFLDMKSSTTIAEKLGHEQYFKLLRDFYDSLSESIINREGEVYQYIGDEVVISWKKAKGLANQNCLRCFDQMKQHLKSKEAYFTKHYGLLPAFKAGMHLGPVTTGEIGALKKEIFFTGDVLNTTARIQASCNDFNTDLLLSKALANALPQSDTHSFNTVGEVQLRGREAPIELVSVRRL